MSEKLKPCPFCGANVRIEKRPLWEGTRGYLNCYEYDIRCHSCGCRVRLERNDTIYRSEEEAERNAVQAWNKRAPKEENESKARLIAAAPELYEAVCDLLDYAYEALHWAGGETETRGKAPGIWREIQDCQKLIDRVNGKEG